ncbi:hypothetical protein BaRGS_00004271 [Batillaria attramentaria]|uniref:Uncharacterized protein n=1 Tax=Batillaria attramentaria TaxID=370345 RepID=A0ABD0LYX7_9CAEN
MFTGQPCGVYISTAKFVESLTLPKINGEMKAGFRRLFRQKRGCLASMSITLFTFYVMVFVCLRHVVNPPTVVYVLEPGFPIRRRTSTDFMSGSGKKSFLNSTSLRGHRIPQRWPRALNWRRTETYNRRIRAISKTLPRCDGLISGNPNEQTFAENFMAHFSQIVRTDHDCIRDTKNCTRYLQQRGFFLGASQEEQDFPIAYSIVLYKDTHLLERLLRAIYRPHNAYCLHVDKKTPPATVQAVKNIASCLQNVFLASDRLDVQWGTFSVLEAELVCMKDLWRDKRWRYFINLTGQEFPLKTNLQLVRILQAFNGSNNVDCTTNTRYSYRWYNNFGAPHNITPLKGNVHAVLSRGFVDFVLHEPVARDLLDWVKFTDFPDETFFSTLNHNPHLGVPGSYVGPPDTDASSKPYLARFKNWGDNWYDGQGRTNFNWPCFGKRVRNICIFGVGDLPMLTSRKELFANKFHSDFEPVALECLEEWLFNMTLEEYAGTVDFDVSFYENLDIVKHRVLPRLHDSRNSRQERTLHPGVSSRR